MTTFPEPTVRAFRLVACLTGGDGDYRGMNAANWFRDLGIFGCLYSTKTAARAAIRANYRGPDCDGIKAECQIEAVIVPRSKCPLGRKVAA